MTDGPLFEADGDDLVTALRRSRQFSEVDRAQAERGLATSLKFEAEESATGEVRRETILRRQDAEYWLGRCEDILLILDRRIEHGQTVEGAYRAAILLLRRRLAEAGAGTAERRTLPRRITRLERRLNEMTVGRSVL